MNKLILSIVIYFMHISQIWAFTYTCPICHKNIYVDTSGMTEAEKKIIQVIIVNDVNRENQERSERDEILRNFKVDKYTEKDLNFRN